MYCLLLTIVFVSSFNFCLTPCPCEETLPFASQTDVSSNLVFHALLLIFSTLSRNMLSSPKRPDAIAPWCPLSSCPTQPSRPLRPEPGPQPPRTNCLGTSETSQTKNSKLLKPLGLKQALETQLSWLRISTKTSPPS